MLVRPRNVIQLVDPLTLAMRKTGQLLVQAVSQGIGKDEHTGLVIAKACFPHVIYIYIYGTPPPKAYILGGG